MADFLVRRREFIEHKQTMYGRRSSWGPWRTLHKVPDLETARDLRGRQLTGIHQTVVFYQGKIVIDALGYVNAWNLERAGG